MKTYTKHNFQRILKFRDSKPLLAHVSGWVSQISRHSAHEGDKVINPTHRPTPPHPPPPANIPGTYFWWTLSQTQGNSAAGRNMSMKYCNDITGKRTRDFPACSSLPQPCHRVLAYQNLHRVYKNVCDQLLLSTTKPNY